MGNRKISDDNKETALRLLTRGRDTVDEVLELVNFSESTLYRTLRRKRATGSVAKAQAIGRGRPRLLLHRDCQYLLTLARHKPTMFLDEYVKRLADGRLLEASLATIHCSFVRAGLNVKQVQKLAAERSPTVRADFVRRISRYPTEYLMCIDETSKDDRTYACLWGRARRGVRVEQHAPFVRKRRFSLVAAMALDEGIVAAKVIEGSFKRDSFMEYLRDDVLPMTTPYPGLRSVLVMDNARIHHAEEIENLVQDYGCCIKYLPAYSPDFNPIEQAFSAIKAHLRQQGITFFGSEGLYYELYCACDVITPEMTWGFFSHSGYVV